MSSVIEKYISACSLLLFIIPLITLLICIQIHVLHYDFHLISLIDGKISVSLIGRQEKTIGIFKSGFLIYMLVSVFFYFKIPCLLALLRFYNSLLALLRFYLGLSSQKYAYIRIFTHIFNIPFALRCFDFTIPCFHCLHK